MLPFGLRPRPGRGLTIAAVVGGSSDIAYADTFAGVNAIHNGFDIRLVAGANHTSQSVNYLVRADSDIEGVEDFKGRKLGLGAVPFFRVFANKLLESNDIDPSEVDFTLIRQTPALAETLENGAVDIIQSNGFLVTYSNDGIGEGYDFRAVVDPRTAKRDPDEIVHITVPRLIDETVFEAVQAKLAANNPRINPARAVSGPILLTGLARCAYCGSGMTQRTGTSSSGKVYSYYACAGRAQRGPTACKGNAIAMTALDTKVVDALRERLLAPERLAAMLAAFAGRRSERAAAVNERLVGLQRQADEARDKLDRLYRLVEDGLEIDDVLKERIDTTKSEHARTKAALERGKEQIGVDAAIDPAQITAFSNLMKEVLHSPDNPVRKIWLRALLSKIEVDADRIRIIGSKEILNAAVAASANSDENNVQKCVPKWRTRHDSNV